MDEFFHWSTTTIIWFISNGEKKRTEPKLTKCNRRETTLTCKALLGWQHKKSIELHAPTSSTQKPKLMGKGGQFTYTPTLWLPHCQLCPQLSCQPMANTLQHRRPPSELDWIDLLGGFVHSFKHQMVSLVYLNETIPTSWNCIKWPKNSFSHRHHLSMYPFISIHP